MDLLTTEYADVMELVDVPDSKSGVGNYVPVRPRPSAFFTLEIRYENRKYKLHYAKGSFLCAKKPENSKTDC